LNPEKFIGYLIKSAGRAFANNVNKKIKELGLKVTVEQVGIIFRLTYMPGRTQQDLAEFFLKDKTTIARILGTMEKNNIVVRVPSEVDKRTNLLYLTNKGKEVQSTLAVAAIGVSDKAIENIDAAELEVCKRVLNQIRINLENE